MAELGTLERLIAIHSQAIAEMKAHEQSAEETARLTGVLQSRLELVRICTAIAAEKLEAVQQKQGLQ
jgi:hypothetical protein